MSGCLLAHFGEERIDTQMQLNQVAANQVKLQLFTTVWFLACDKHTG